MGFTTDLVAGVGAHLDAEGVGLWLASGAYPASPARPPIFVDVLPGAPDLALALSAYGVEDTADGHSTVGVNVRVRGTRDGRTARDLDDAVFLALHRPLGIDLPGGIRVAVSYRASGPAVLGRDGNDRTELTSNYYLLVPRASVDPWA